MIRRLRHLAPAVNAGLGRLLVALAALALLASAMVRL